MKNIKVMRAKVGERLAIMARAKEGEPWVQVESILGTHNAQELADRLDSDGFARSDYIGQGDGDWGDDAPAEAP